MENFFYIFLFIIWSIFWSFWSVLIYRLKTEEKWILFWRSHCKDCNTTLKFFDLFPIFSWLFNLWKCRYCKNKIWAIYPALEISTWIIFSLVWIFLVDVNQLFLWNYIEILKIIFWLIISFVTILYIFYDLLFTEIHEWIMWVWIFLAFLWLVANNFFKLNYLISSQNLINIEFISSIILWIIILILFYIIMLKWMDEIYDLWILAIIWLLLFAYKKFFPETDFSSNSIISWIIWAYWIFIFFFLQIFLTKWAALWGWDLRIWIMIWLLLWINFSFIWIFSAYILWSLIWVFILIKNRKNKWKNIVPFWPFLWSGFIITLFFWNEILNFVINNFSLL